MPQALSPNGLKRVINGQRYTVDTSTVLASNSYWDGHNFERNGRNTWLLKTKNGAYFSAECSMWEGERDSIEPLSRADAMELYESLPEHLVNFETAFDAVVEAAAGRPTFYGEKMRQTAVRLPENMIAHLKSQPGKQMGEVLRDLIARDMQTK